MVRRAFTEKLEESLAILASLVPAKAASRRDDVAIRLFSSMLGGLILSRAVDDELLSRRILRTVADELKSMPGS
jgi:TetR/AcrR family transcriptional regulator, transcriptional repressor for nem operon